MLNSELIKLLQELPKDLEIVIKSDFLEDWATDFNSVSKLTLEGDSDLYGKGASLSEEYAQGTEFILISTDELQ